MKQIFKKYHIRLLAEITGFSIGTLKKMRAGTLPDRIHKDERGQYVAVPAIAIEQFKRRVREYEQSK